MQLIAPLNQKTDLTLTGGFRLGRDVSHLVDERGGAGLNVKINKYLSLSPAWLYIATQPQTGRKGFENRLNFAALFSLPLGRFTLSDRHQVERRLLHGRPDATRYRNRLQLERPLNFGEFKFKPFVSWEIFYDSSVHAWSRQRCLAGVSKNLNKHLSVDVYFMHQQDDYVRPGNLNVFATLFRIRL